MEDAATTNRRSPPAEIKCVSVLSKTAIYRVTSSAIVVVMFHDDGQPSTCRSSFGAEYAPSTFVFKDLVRDQIGSYHPADVAAKSHPENKDQASDGTGQCSPKQTFKNKHKDPINCRH